MNAKESPRWWCYDGDKGSIETMRLTQDREMKLHATGAWMAAHMLMTVDVFGDGMEGD